MNLKGLNRFVEHIHFKMECIVVMKRMVRKGDFTKIDLQDAYFTIPITQSIRNFFSFYGRGPFFNSLAFVLGSRSPPGLH